MHSVQRVGIMAELVGGYEAEAGNGSLRVAIESFVVLAGGTRVDTSTVTGVHHIGLSTDAGAWSLELIEAAVREHAASMLTEGGAELLFGRLVGALHRAGIQAEASDLAAVPIEVELGSKLWQRFSAIADERPAPSVVPEPVKPSTEPDAATTQELEQLLMYAEHCGEAADRSQREDIRSSTLAYIGGALTTMLHLGHIDERQHSEWHERLTQALGEPPDGWKFVGW